MAQVLRYIAEGKAQGAQVLTGGKRSPIHDKGCVPHNCMRVTLWARGQKWLGRVVSRYYIQPTIFVDVKPWMSIWREEIFGPVRVPVLP